MAGVAEQIYEPQLDPARSAPLPGGDPAAYGAEVGPSMERLGETLHASDVTRYRIDRDRAVNREAADFNARFAAYRDAADQWSIEARNGSGPGAAGHAQAAAKWAADNSAPLVQGITEQRVLDAAQQQIRDFNGRFGAAERDFEEGARVGKLVADQQSTIDLAANRARRNHDPRSFDEELRIAREGIGALAVNDGIKEKLLRRSEQAISGGYLNGLVDTQPKAAIALVDSGAFDGLLTPEQLDAVRAGGQVEVRRADAAAEHQAAIEKAQTADLVQGYKAQIEAGVSVPDETLATLQDRLAAGGDKGGAIQLGILRDQNRISRETEPWTPLQFDAEINRLAGQDKRSAAEDLRLATLRRLRPAAVATFNGNPGEWAAKNGVPPPALDLADPASIGARLNWARAVQSRTGRPIDPLLPAEVAALREQAAQSPAGRIAVADSLAPLGGYAALRAARQVAPGDPMLGRLAQLPDPVTRRTAQRGAEVRKARTDLIDGVNGASARDDFYEALGGAGALMDPGDVAAAFEVARNLYAARVEDSGYDGAAFKRAAHEALGGRWDGNGRQIGGIGSHGRAPVLLPDDMTDATFDKAMGYLGGTTFKDGPLAPVWSTGQKMTGADVAKFIPVRRPDGTYEFHDASGAKVTIGDGRTWTLDIRRFARELGL